MRFPRILGFLLIAGSLVSPAMASCPGFSIIVAHTKGNIITSPGKEYGGWFWVPGKGNNLINDQTDARAGIDSGVSGGVPLDPASRAAWLLDSSGAGATRFVAYDWRSVGSDGCPDSPGDRQPSPKGRTVL